MFRRIDRIAALVATLAIATPALAQAAYDLPAARAAYEAGKASGLSPQTKGEALACAAYWDAVASAAKRGYISEEQLAEIGPAFTNKIPEMRASVWLAKGAEASKAEETFKEYYKAASVDFAGFIQGDADATASLFETIGVCDAA